MSIFKRKAKNPQVALTPDRVPYMELRDYFATEGTTIQSNMSPESICEITGVELPKKDAGFKVWFDFWMTYEAYRRYAYADAMLKERNKK